MLDKCKVNGCSQPRSKKAGFGMCQHHYAMLKLHGDPLYKSDRNRDGHTLEHRREYTTYSNLRQRCYNKNNPRYGQYGGRGIRVCDRWLEKPNGFKNFIEDMGKRPKGCSLDRIDVNGDYCPENCRWADDNIQATNTARKRACSRPGVRVVHGYYHAYLKKDGIMHEGKYYKEEQKAIDERIELERKILGYVIGEV